MPALLLQSVRTSHLATWGDRCERPGKQEEEGGRPEDEEGKEGSASERERSRFFGRGLLNLLELEEGGEVGEEGWREGVCEDMAVVGRWVVVVMAGWC